MRASDAQAGDILRGIPEMYWRSVDLRDGVSWRGFEPNPPHKVLTAHRWMAWYSEGGFRPGGDDVFVYVGHRWVYKTVDGKRKKRIVREVLFRGEPCWIDPAVWKYLEKVED